MTSKQILEALKAAGSENIKKIFLKHGATEPCYGVKVEDMKLLLKKLKPDNKVAIELFNSGIYDAMYFAGLMGDGSLMSTKELDALAQKAYGGWASEYAVPWLAAENKEGFALALQWIDSKTEPVAAGGWSTLSTLVSVKPDDELDIKRLSSLLTRVEKDIHKSANRVRYTMNGFVIAVGSYVPALTAAALNTAAKVGVVQVNMGDTACKVPAADEYINKVKNKGSIGKKRKHIKC